MHTPIFFRSTLLLLAASLAMPAAGYPTKRALPPGVIANHPDWLVLRDHEEVRTLHLVPRRYTIVENTLRPYGDQEANCTAVEEYDRAVLDLLGARRKHAEVRKSLAERLAKIAKDQERLLSAQVDSVLKKKELEDLLKNADTLPDEKKKKVQKELDDANRWITTFNQQLDNLEKFKKVADNEQSDALKQIDALEASLEKFTERMARPSGQVQIRLRLPGDPDTDALRTALGATDRYKLLIARPVGLALTPTTEDELGYRETAKRTPINTFKPDWNIKPVVPSAAWFGTSELPNNVDWLTLENEVSFEHMVSLAVFCAHKKSAQKDRLFTAISIRYEYPLWNSPAIAGSNREIAAHRVRLPDAAWKIVEAFTPADPAATAMDRDLGDPALYSTTGIFERASFPLTFKFDLSPKKETTK